MGRLIILFSLIVICQVTNAGDSIPSRLSIKGDFKNFAVDNAGNIYLQVGDYRLEKRNGLGELIASYEGLIRSGQISHIDVANPMKILVFHKETGNIEVLNRVLGRVQVINTRKLNITRATAVTNSYDGNFWIYDEATARIIKIDNRGSEILASPDLRTVFGFLPTFSAIFDDNNKLFLYERSTGWYIFDRYVSFSGKLTAPGWKDVQLINGSMTGRSDTSLHASVKGLPDFRSLNAKKLLDGAIRIFRTPGELYVLYPGRLEIFPAP